TALAGNPQSITADPEFKALNPRIPVNPGDPAAAALLAIGGNSDVMYALTSYINADSEARAWLDGTPDPWGMVVNPNYKNISLPLEAWPLLDTFVPDLQALTCQTQSPIVWLNSVASPVPSMATATLDAQFALDWSKIQCNLTVGVAGVDGGVVAQWAGGSLQPIGQRFIIALTTLGEAQRYSLPSASLESSSSVSAKAQFSSAAGRTFVTPTDNALKAAGKAMKFDSTAGTWTLPYDTLRSSTPAAYPGLMTVYADVPTTGLSSGDATDYANLIKFATGTGQTAGYGNGQLPPGYLPMTSANGFGALLDYSTAAAADVAAQNGQVPNQSGTTDANQGQASTDSGTSTNVTSGAPTYSSSTQSSSTTKSTSAPAPSPSAKRSTLAPAQSGALRNARNAAVTSSLGGLILPIVLGIGVLGVLVAIGAQSGSVSIGRRQ
ncbi:MAG: hypothetical protein JO147_04340, partial [Actinobacteria bacterium]|nr:hypothetical protein [Actinomycetota bacterium]